MLDPLNGALEAQHQHFRPGGANPLHKFETMPTAWRNLNNRQFGLEPFHGLDRFFLGPDLTGWRARATAGSTLA